MTIIKKLLAMLMLISNILVLCSCLGSVSLDKYGYVLTLGVDKGTTRKYNVVYLLESETEGGEAGASPKASIVSAEGDNIYDSVYAAESGLPFRLNFTRTGYLVIGFDIAADNELMEFLSVSWAHLRLRTSANMIVSSSTAMEFMEGLTNTDGINIAKLESSLSDFYKRDGLISMMSIAEFLSASESTRFDPVLPLGSVDTSVGEDKQTDTTDGIPRTGGMISYTLGSALFSGSEMCGVLSARESRVLLLAEGNMSSALLQFTRDDGTNYTVELSNLSKPSVGVSFDKDNVIIHYSIPISAIIRQDSSKEQSEAIQKSGCIPDKMCKQICSYLENACMTVFTECQYLNCDSFGTGKEVCKKFRTADEWENYNFKSKLSEVRCSFSVNIETESAILAAYYSD